MNVVQTVNNELICRAAKSPAFAGDLPVFVFLGAYLPSSRLDTSISRICMAYLQALVCSLADRCEM